jgi:hypothetical protein
MMNRIVVVATLTTALGLSTARAQPAGENPPGSPGAAPGQAPRPAAENELFKKSSGSWRCEGTAKTPDGQEVKYKSTWTVKPALGGHWYALVYKRSKMGPMPAFEGNATVGYNAAEKKFVLVGFDNHGSWIDLSSTDGAVYTGDGAPMGQKGPVKFTFSPGKDKKGQESDKLFDVVLDFGAASSSESCKK